jgi:hypothetical protein
MPGISPHFSRNVTPKLNSSQDFGLATTALAGFHSIELPRVGSHGKIRCMNTRWTRDELLKGKFDAARHGTNAVVLCKFTPSLIRRTGSCIQTDDTYILHSYILLLELYNVTILSISQYPPPPNKLLQVKLRFGCP